MILWRIIVLAALLYGVSEAAQAGPHRALMNRADIVGGGLSQVVTGARHSCALPGDGSVRCWGDNSRGQLGDGTTVQRLFPVRVVGIEDALQLGAGDDHTCVLHADGGVSCFGVPPPSGAVRAVPRKLPPFGGFVFGEFVPATPVALAVGARHFCVLFASGSVQCRGDNSRDQLGIGADLAANPLRLVLDHDTGKTLRDVVAVAAARAHTCALLADGAVSCWGVNFPASNGNTARRKAELPPARAIVAGDDHNCALLFDGTVRCWGRNFEGQLGDGGASGTDGGETPVAVAGLTNVVAIAAGAAHTCAATSGGRAFCWGRNTNGQLGDGSTITRRSPVATVVSNVEGLAAGVAHSCALVSQGRLQCWGANASGQLGNGRTTDARGPVLTSLTRSIGARGIGAFANGSCAARVDGLASCWGANQAGQAGVGAKIPAAVLAPSAVATISGAVDVSPGGAHGCLRLANGRLNCWGSNALGQIGDGSFLERLAPAEIMSGQIAVVSGERQSCAISAASRLTCWGSNAYRQIADVSIARFGAPRFVDMDVRQVVIGDRHICWLKADGSARCRGDNRLKQLGDGTATPRGHAVKVIVPEKIVALAAGDNHSCALLADGLIRCWGDNSDFQLGVGGPPQGGPVTPPPITDPVSRTHLVERATAISAGGDTTCAILENDTTECWGDNATGKAGDGTRVSPRFLGGGQAGPVTRTVFVCFPTGCRDVVVSLRSLAAIEVGRGHVCGLRASGAPFCWGLNSSGQLGDGATTAKLRANEVPSFRFNIAPVVALRPVGPVVAALLNCAAGRKAMVELTLIQGTTRASASGVRGCAGGLERYEFATPAPDAVFVPGAAEVRARASILAPSDAGAAGAEAETQSWTRNVTLTAAP